MSGICHEVRKKKIVLRRSFLYVIINWISGFPIFGPEPAGKIELKIFWQHMGGRGGRGKAPVKCREIYLHRNS